MPQPAGFRLPPPSRSLPGWWTQEEPTPPQNLGMDELRNICQSLATSVGTLATVVQAQSTTAAEDRGTTSELIKSIGENASDGRLKITQN